MRGMLGQVPSSALASGEQINQPSALAGVTPLILGGNTATSISLNDLSCRFQTAGLEPQIQSWIGTGENRAISPYDPTEVFPANNVAAGSKQAGTGPDTLLQILTQALPKAVDRVTPNGQVPSRNNDSAGLLGQPFGGQGTTSKA
jgi:uncharacterized protein YidB (DUF937 family)